MTQEKTVVLGFIPANRAASSLPPIAKIYLPKYVRVRMKEPIRATTSMTTIGTGTGPI